MSDASAALPADAPRALSKALAERDAVVSGVRRLHRRVYLDVFAPDRALFARYSTDPADVPILAHEVTVRRVVGQEGALRAPEVLDCGDSWLLEVGISPEPWSGPRCVEAIVEAAARLAHLDLPTAPPWKARGDSLARLRRTAVLARSSLPLSDVWRSKRIRSESGLPLATSHGDFHGENVLFADGAVWVVDWELSGRAPLGSDLMQYWATIPDRDDRELLFEAAVELLGRARRAELLRLRYALVVTTIANDLAAPMAFDRDAEEAGVLLTLLPEVRAEAGFG